MHTLVFGELSASKYKAENTDYSLDYLFKNTNKNLNNIGVVESEQRIALENLRKLTTQLQTRRLRNKTKSSCKYFTI